MPWPLPVKPGEPFVYQRRAAQLDRRVLLHAQLANCKRPEPQCADRPLGPESSLLLGLAGAPPHGYGHRGG